MAPVTRRCDFEGANGSAVCRENSYVRVGQFRQFTIRGAGKRHMHSVRAENYNSAGRIFDRQVSTHLSELVFEASRPCGCKAQEIGRESAGIGRYGHARTTRLRFRGHSLGERPWTCRGASPESSSGRCDSADASMRYKSPELFPCCPGSNHGFDRPHQPQLSSTGLTQLINVRFRMTSTGQSYKPHPIVGGGQR